MDVRMDEGTNGCIDVWLHAWMHGWTYVCVDGWIGLGMGGRMDEQVTAMWIDGSWMDGWADS